MASTSKSVNITHASIGSVITYINSNKQKPLEDITINLTNPISCFKGREQKLEEIEEHFKTNQIVVIHGPPGMGKTETASQFAVNGKNEKQETHYNGNLLWIHAETEDKLKDCFDKLKPILDLPKDAAPAQIYAKFKSSSCLFVFDNAENMKSIQDYLPVFQLNRNVKILITSQHIQWNGDFVAKVSIKAIEEKDALEIFKHKLGDKYNEYPEEIWKDLAEHLEGIPLSIQIVSSIIRDDDCDVENFISDLKNNKFIHLEFPDSEIDHYGKSVLTSISSSLDRFKDAPHVIDLLCFMAYLDADKIYDTNLLLVPSVEEPKEKLKKALLKLKNYSLIQLKDLKMRNGIKRSKIKIHRTIQHVLRNYDLNEKSGAMFKIILKTILPKSYEMRYHYRSVFKYVKENEYEDITIKLYIENDFLNKTEADSCLLQPAYYHCDRVLREVLPKFKDKYNGIDEYNKILNKMMYVALRNRNNDLQTIDLLITYGAKIENDKVFQYASKWLSIELFDRLLKPTVSKNIINSKVSWGKTILHLLVREFNKENMKNTIECMNHLITNYKADITIKDTILHTACRNENICLEMIKYLIEKCDCKQFVNIQNQNEDKRTPLQILFISSWYNSNYSQIVSYFVNECEADITIQDYNEQNTLFYICAKGTSEIVEFVLKNRKCQEIINNQDIRGDVAFTHLISNESIEEEEKIQLTKLFIENEMNFNIKNKMNKTPVEIAKENKYTKLSEEIKKQLNRGSSSEKDENDQNLNPSKRRKI